MSDTRRQRWIKYGGNVALGCVLVIALAVLVTWAAERHPKRIDTTAEGLYSLKPQTIKIIRDLTKPIRLVSLYTQTKPPQTADQEDQARAAIIPQDQAAETVNDLLQEYANKGRGITLETIDPVTSPTKVDDLIEEVEAKYGGEVKKYAVFVQSFKGTIDQITKITDPEVKAVDDLLPHIENPNPDLVATLREVIMTVDQFPKSLADLQDALQKPLRQKPPDYKGAADAITEGMNSLSTFLDAVINNFTILQKKGGLPPAVDQYMKDSLPHFQAIKKIVDDLLARGKQLGELKLDTLRSALREKNTILVMGDKEWRAINYDQVWQPAGRTAMTSLSDTPPKPRFAGEQQVTAAILALASGGQKQKVAIVRAGGPPLAQSVSFMGGEPPLAEAVGRLALYNYDVVEKDLTGQFAQQSGGMGAAEPTDDEIKNATWIVWAFKGQQSQFGTEPPSIAAQVAAHLKAGGSAVILTGWHQDGMAEAISDWGVDVSPAQIIVHELITSKGDNSSDDLQRALRMPYILDLHEFGDHALTRPLASLEGIFLGMSPVKWREDVKGYHATPLLPIPTSPGSPHTWASSSYSPNDPTTTPKFDPAVDTDGPLYAGAAVEKYGGGRLVVLAAGDFASNQFLEFTDQQFNPDAPPVLRFPANGELFTNSVFWASHQDTLIDISPAAMDIGRIGDMSTGALRFWRVGVLLIGLPCLVLFIGAGVYLKRRD